MKSKKTITKYLDELLAKEPIDLSKLSDLRKDMTILRVGIIAEYDAINVYEQMMEQTSNKMVKKLLLDISNEEKVHVGELEGLLKRIDMEHAKFVAEGEQEVADLMKD